MVFAFCSIPFAVFFKVELWQNCRRGEEREKNRDIILARVKTRISNSALTFIRGCRPRLVKNITMTLIFSVFSTKATGFQGQCGHLKGVIVSSSYFPSPNLLLNEVKFRFRKGCDALNAFFYSYTLED